WVFHGAKDDAVPIAQAESMVNALKRCEGNVQFTVYPDAGHDSWTETYNNPQLYKWLLQQTKKEKKLIIINKENVSASSGDAYNAFDGNFGSRWESEQSDPQWIEINFNHSQLINHISIYWETAFGKEYEILSSDDNINWKKVFTENNSNGDVDRIDLDNLEARYLKINMLHRGTQWAYSIWEIEIE
ncbi:MAG: discoidin domain-containing protein, partial [Ignavibacteriaceae bacterium]